MGRWFRQWMTPVAGMGLVALLAACGGSGGGTQTPHAPAGPSFQIRVDPARLAIPAGAHGTVQVTLSPLNGFQSPVDISLEGAPQGVTGQAHLAAGATTCALTITVPATATPLSGASATLSAKGAGLQRQTAFTLDITAPLPPARLSTDMVQASGASQQGGRLQNRAVSLEPLAARTSTSPNGTETRSGFRPKARE